MNHHELGLLVRVLVGAGVSYAIGFEREIRGAPAGDRTFCLIGTGAAAATAVTFSGAPQAISGILTGVGFVGAGLVVRGGRGMVVGVTSAAAIFVVAAIGVVAGAGHPLLAALVGVIVLLDLEIRHLPVLRWLDARRYVSMVADDTDMPEHH